MPRTPRNKPVGLAITPETPAAAGKVVEATTAADVARFTAEATGPVVLEFVDPANCEHCVTEIPEVDAIAKGCGNVTVIRADIKHAEMDKLADDYGIEGLPTLFLAGKGSDLKPGSASMIDDSDALRKRLKCPREPKA